MANSAARPDLSRRILRVGTRGSALALEQTRRVVAALAVAAPELRVETVPMSTIGDRDKQTPLAILGGTGIFAKELEAALLAGEIDFAVHSAKDLTSTLPEGLTLGAISERDDPRDAFISTGVTLEQLPAGARVGTSSRRRAVQLHQLRPDLVPVELRGNVDTRLRKVREGQVDAGIMAASGLLRMGWTELIAEYLPLDTFIPAPGQGALAVECRADDELVLAALALIDDPILSASVAIERAFLRAVGAGCRSPLGAYAVVHGERVGLRGMLGDEAGTLALYTMQVMPLRHAEEMAAEAALSLAQAVADRTASRS